MIKFGLAFLITVFLAACGVDTSSSSRESGVKVLTDSELVISNPIDPNPVDSGDTTNPDDSDSNDSDPGNSDSETTDTVNPSYSDFDTVGAIEDSNACKVGIYSDTRDASYSGQEEFENGSSGAISETNDVSMGLVIRSEYLSQDYESTLVTLYNKSFPSPSDLNSQGAASYTMDNVFSLSYDLAWADESIANVDNIVYVKSDKSAKPSCYRLTLNTIFGDEIDVQKVYRVRL